MNEIKTGLTNFCRYCDAEISFGTSYEVQDNGQPSPWSSTGWWSNFGDTEVMATKRCKGSENSAIHEPKNFCNYTKGDNTYCHKPIKPQDVRAGMYACGVHMRFALEDVRRAEALKASLEQQEEKQAILDWKAGLYQEAWDKLVRFFGDDYKEALGLYMGRVEEGPVERYREKVARIREDMTCDIVTLVELLESKGIEL